MIWGRNPALWLGLVAAILNTLVVVFNIALTAEQIVSLNALAFAVVAVVANEADPTTAGTFALTTKAPASGSVTTKG